MSDKKENTNHVNALATTGLSGKSITGVDVWKAGSVDIIEINYVGGPYFIKVKSGRVEVGGTADFGSGTVLY